MFNSRHNYQATHANLFNEQLNHFSQWDLCVKQNYFYFLQSSSSEIFNKTKIQIPNRIIGKATNQGISNFSNNKINLTSIANRHLIIKAMCVGAKIRGKRGGGGGVGFPNIHPHKA